MSFVRCSSKFVKNRSQLKNSPLTMKSAGCSRISRISGCPSKSAFRSSHYSDSGRYKLNFVLSSCIRR